MAIGRTEDRDTPGDPVMLQHRIECSEPDPRNPSGPAVDRTAHTGRTHDRNRPDPSLPAQNPCNGGGRPHMDPGFRRECEFNCCGVKLGNRRGDCGIALAAPSVARLGQFPRVVSGRVGDR